MAAGILLIALIAFATLPAHAQTFTLIHSFSGPDGANPAAGLTMDRAGNLYGTALYGGAHNCIGLQGCGAVFKLTHVQSSWVLSLLYSFSGGADGGGPAARVVFGPDGALYGTTAGGGPNTVFRLQPPATICPSISCFWTKTTLFSFDIDDLGTGFNPLGDLAFDAAGNIYGTNQYGGNSQYCNGPGCGLVYELTQSGGVWTENVLYTFLGEGDGGYPESGVIFDQAGNLYGTAFLGHYQGSTGGVVFELSPSGSGWTQNVLYHFQDSGDGGYPVGGLIFDASGNLYGTTSYGGSGNGGTVFELSPLGGYWNFKLLYSLSGNGESGSNGKLVEDSAGNLYGTSFEGGTHGYGNVFKLTPSNGGWIYTDLHDFTLFDGGGAYPLDGLVLDAGGNIYGTAEAGGNSGEGCGTGLYCGVVFEITP